MGGLGVPWRHLLCEDVHTYSHTLQAVERKQAAAGKHKGYVRIFPEILDVQTQRHAAAVGTVRVIYVLVELTVRNCCCRVPTHTSSARCETAGLCDILFHIIHLRYVGRRLLISRHSFHWGPKPTSTERLGYSHGRGAYSHDVLVHTYRPITSLGRIRNAALLQLSQVALYVL